MYEVLTLESVQLLRSQAHLLKYSDLESSATTYLARSAVLASGKEPEKKCCPKIVQILQ